MLLRSLLLSSALLAAGIGPVGCAPMDGEADEARADVTNIPQTSVKAQQIGNCWIYTTVAWAESLHLSATGEQLDLSETWLTYWRFFE